ncbi:MAG: hypothetical protein AAGD13_06715 [Pseudomonadota bacterium]
MLDGSAPDTGTILLSFGGGRLKHWSRAPEFFLLSALAVRQARRSPGNVFTRVGRLDGMLFSYSGWESEVQRQSYARRGAHGVALRRTAALVDWFEFHHFRHSAAPSFRDAYALWADATGR